MTYFFNTCPCLNEWTVCMNVNQLQQGCFRPRILLHHLTQEATEPVTPASRKTHFPGVVYLEAAFFLTPPPPPKFRTIKPLPSLQQNKYSTKETPTERRHIPKYKAIVICLSQSGHLFPQSLYLPWCEAVVSPVWLESQDLLPCSHHYIDGLISIF